MATTTVVTTRATSTPLQRSSASPSSSSKPRSSAATYSSKQHPRPQSPPPPAAPPSSRRAVLRKGALVGVGAFVSQVVTPWLGSRQSAVAFPLAPLGKVEAVGGEKMRGLTLEQLKDQLEKDLREGQYFVTVGDVHKT